jgi:hypothetical protein
MRRREFITLDFFILLTNRSNRTIREIETHEVCPGRKTAPGFFHVRYSPGAAAGPMMRPSIPPPRAVACSFFLLLTS